MNIYFISGLGADKRIFQKLVLPDYYQFIYLDWLPVMPSDTLESYAFRMAQLIDTSVPFYVIGVSFGGMIATEIAKKLKPLKTIIISSIGLSAGLPWYWRFFGKLSLDRFIPVTIFALPIAPTYWLFGAKDAATKLLLKQILLDTDKVFMKWAIRAILTWDNQRIPTSVIHIHGTHDKILPIRFTTPDLIVMQGGHLMVYSHSNEVSHLVGLLLI
ncbi:alpha/beta hydrolase [Spirosoma aureum]|uniref:Alpha/beta hydrolase n=1 Tax=Spirosoma aureum TaxID=2692134 RepID=A0A6G9AQ88_9BACT|nr:alpha/beta hydrolase [Spirosoma aureum]QIP14651.1 alpha/beta hydrolase [Spirosoma aureum]